MKFNLKKSVSRSGLTAALSFAILSALPGVASADALAQSILNISNFQITSAAGATITYSGTGANSSYQASLVGFGGCGANNIAGLNPLLTCAVGPNSGLYAPGVPNFKPNAPTGTFAGSSVSVTGNALAAGALAKADNTVSLLPTGDGASISATNLSSDFQVVVTAPTTLSFSFSSLLFLRAYLFTSQPFLGGNSTANAGWSVNIRDNDNNGALVFSWAPDGTVNAIVGGIETADSFALNGTNNLSVNSNNKDFQYNSATAALTSNFAASTNTLRTGSYVITVDHKSQANSNLAVPEPGSLALVGVSLLGLAAVGRRRGMRQAT